MEAAQGLLQGTRREGTGADPRCLIVTQRVKVPFSEEEARVWVFSLQVKSIIPGRGAVSYG